MSVPPPTPPRRILFGTGATPSPSAGGAPLPAAVPPPPWKRDPLPGLTVAVPHSQAAALVDVGAMQARIDDNLARLRSDALSLQSRLDTLLSGFAPSMSAAVSASGATLAQALADIGERHAGRVEEADGRLTAAAETARADVASSISDLAGGWASADLAAGPGEHPATRAPADYSRFGAVAIDGGEVAAIAPLGPGAGWFISGDEDPAQELQLATVLRLVAQSPVANIAIDVFDPRMSARLGALAPLRAMSDSVFPPPQTQGDLFGRRLEDIVAAAATNAERVVGGGARSLTGLWRSHDTHEGTLNVVVVLDYPYGVDRRLQEALRRLAALGPAAGTILLVQNDVRAVAATDVHVADVRSALLDIRVDGTGVTAQGFPEHIRVTRDSPPAPSSIAGILRGVKERAAQEQGPVVPLEGLLADAIAAPWSRGTTDAIEMTIGRSGRELLEVQLRTENPPHPNMLIGGAVGTGKSNLLLDLIYSSALAHSPDELELVLLDFKRGLEFKRFGADDNGESWLPHVSVLSLESNQEFGVAVLEYVNDEMERRAELFKNRGGHQSINAYRRSTGEVLPRMLLVIDEFHILFDGEDRLTETAVSLLEVIAKQGRAYGIHLLMASQTLSGISGLRSKGQSIFAQFPIRISLKNTPDESQAILAAHNTAAADLTHRGEVIVNRNFGNPASNERGVAAFVAADRFAAVQRQLWKLDAGTQPLVFLGRQAAEWDLPALNALRPSGSTDASLELWVGRPIRVTTTPSTVTLRTDVAQAVAILGPDHDREPVVPSVIAGMIITASLQLLPGDYIAVLDGTGERPQPWLAAAVEHARGRGIRVTVIPASGCAAYLRDELGTRTRDSYGTVLAILLAVQRIPGLDDSAPETVDPPADDTGNLTAMRLSMFPSAATGEGTGRGALRQLVRDGALRGVHIVGWWSGVAALTADLGMAHTGVATYLTASLGQEDLRNIVSTYAPRIDGHPRIGLLDRNSSTGLRSTVPFQQWDDDHTARFESVR